MNELCDLDALALIGRTSLEMTYKAGQFYFPKITVGRPDGKVEVAMTDGTWETFEEGMRFTSERPIEWLAYTADSYHMELTPEHLEHFAGMEIISAKDMFEAGDPRASEALQITLVVGLEATTVTLPYTREGDTIVWGEPVNGKPVVDRHGEAMKIAIQRSHRWQS